MSDVTLLSGKISPHFSWSEFWTTEHRDLLLPNAQALSLDKGAQAAITVLCNEICEPIRAHFGGRSFNVHSGYRFPLLNTTIKGSTTSQHMKGEGVDFHITGVSLQEIFDWIRKESNLKYGQVIIEGAPASWVHVSLGEPYRAPTLSREALMWKGEFSKQGNPVYERP